VGAWTTGRSWLALAAAFGHRPPATRSYRRFALTHTAWLAVVHDSVAAWPPGTRPSPSPFTLAMASAAAFVLAFISAVAGFGGGVLALPMFTALFGLRVAVLVLTVTQLASNTGRVWLNRHDLRWHLIRRFALGAVPMALLGGLLFTRAPLAPLQQHHVRIPELVDPGPLPRLPRLRGR
jgi:hypothetical protein